VSPSLNLSLTLFTSLSTQSLMKISLRLTNGCACVRARARSLAGELARQQAMANVVVAAMVLQRQLGPAQIDRSLLGSGRHPVSVVAAATAAQSRL